LPVKSASLVKTKRRNAQKAAKNPKTKETKAFGTGPMFVWLLARLLYLII
jgi:hypothetical protein